MSIRRRLPLDPRQITSAVRPGAYDDGAVSYLRAAAQRILAVATKLRAHRTHPAVYLIAVALFIGLGFVALARFPADQVDEPRLWPIIVLLVIAVPLNIVTNALEYRLQARIVDLDVGPLRAARVSILATASNMLPIPGSIVVRTTSLIEQAGAKRASATSAVVGLVWLGVTLLPSAIAIGFITGLLPGTLLAAAGALVLSAGVLGMRRLTPRWPAILAPLLAVELATVGIAGFRFWLVLSAIGYDVEFAQLLPLTLAGALASASGFLPAGIGVRESAAAVIAAMVNIPASVGYVAAAGDTLATILVIGALALVLVTVDRWRRPRTVAH